MALTPVAAGGLVTVLAVGLVAFGFLERVRPSPAFQLSFFGSGALLLAWAVVVFGRAHRAGRDLFLEIVVRKQHYVQAFAQATFLAYWGYYWRPVYDSVFLIAAQILLAYAVEMLLSWGRRDTYRLGLGPVPVIFSINLFLWFVDDWFYLQFVLVALGLAAKELIRWDKDGRRVHIFNPSSFALAVFSLALILTGTSDLTWGQDIATTQFFPPQVYLVVFLVGLPGQLLFGVTTMTMSAVVTTYVCGLVYFATTGVYFFYDSYIPIAVFLGMHLLFTDPSTAPRTDLGRVLFGALYGLSTVALYAVLFRAGVPPFYDKLLQVPLLNLSIQRLDRVARLPWLRPVDPSTFGRSLTPPQRHLLFMAVWTVVFALMSASHGLGDRHPGQWVPFWQQACAEGRPHACSYLEGLQLRLCQSGSGWACNEAGVRRVQRARSGDDSGRFEPAAVADTFARGCARGFDPACENQTRWTDRLETLVRAPPTLADYPMVLRGTKGPIEDRSPAALYDRACRQGWVDACGRRADVAP